ncbi:MAG: hypothetical protein KTR19_03335 [Hyphomicrobiales bacterium]|nr:hypothetical protein [Hyphomicrobiales bacterium]
MEPAGSGLELISWQGWSVTGSISAMLILLVTILLWLLPFPRDALLENIADPEQRRDIRARLGEGGVFYRFMASITNYDDWLQRWFGRRWSGQAFERCVAIAFAFPVALFLLASVLAGYGASEISFGEILLFFFGVIVVSVATGSLFRVGYAFFRRMWSSIGGDNELAEIITRIALGAFAVVFAFAISFAVASSVAGEISDVGTVFFAIIGGFAFALAFAIAFAFAGVWAFLIALIIVTIVALTLAKDFAFFLLLFFVILPVLNALIDWGSWAITRFHITIIGTLQHTIGGYSMAILVLIADVIAALTLVVILAALLPIGLELADTLLSIFGRDGFDWRSTASQAVTAPWNEGLFVTGMLLTPIIPTLALLTIAIGSLFMPLTPATGIALAGISSPRPDSDEDEGEDEEEDETEDIPPGEEESLFAARVVYLSRLWYIPALLISMGIFILIWWLVTLFDLPVANFLYELALCSTSWGSGQCRWF